MRFFTHEEANQALELLRPQVERLVERRRLFLELAAEVETVRASVAANGGRIDPERMGEVRDAADTVAEELAALVEEIHRLGVQVKDLDQGLVDFPAVHPESGDTVLLCWRLGEPEVAWWHGPEDGFAGRKPLPF
jgi:hypothetical protein